MKSFIRVVFVMLLAFLTTACKNDKVEYSIIIDQNLQTEFTVGDELVDFKDYFMIVDNKGNVIEVTNAMIDSSEVDFTSEGTYTVKISYQGVKKELEIKVNSETAVSYTITINSDLPTEFAIGTSEVDFTNYFIIKDSLENEITVTNDMIDSSAVDFNQTGTYLVRITYQNINKEFTITVVDEVTPTYQIIVNENKLTTTIEIGTEILSFKDYFKIKDNLGNVIDVEESMINTASIDFNKVGTYVVTITYQGYTAQLTFEVIENTSANRNSTDLFISEYAEGKNHDKYIELFNGTGKEIDLSNYSIVQYNNGNIPPLHNLQLSGKLKDGETFVIYHPQAQTAIKSNGDVAHEVTAFNGNDVIALFNNDKLIDIFGDLNNKVDKGWTVAGINNATLDHTLIRKSNVYGPNIIWNPNEWIVLDVEDFSNINQHTMDNYTPKEDEDHNPVVPPQPRVKDLFISEYFEGDGEYKDSKYIEIYNGLAHDVDLSEYSLAVYKNGLVEPAFVQSLQGILSTDDVFIVYAPYSHQNIQDIGNIASEVCYFNGKAAIALLKNGEVIDIIGVLGEYPEKGWIVDFNTTTMNNTLIRKESIDSPTHIWDPNEWYICFENYLFDIGNHFQINERTVFEDFSYLIDMMTELQLDSKGDATSDKPVKLKGTVFMDVSNETTLVYITDGYHFIKLHGDKIHNYTTPGVVYEITCYYQVYKYMPNFSVANPSTDIKRLTNETAITEVYVMEVTVDEIVSLKKENFIENINNGYLQLMLKVVGYLQFDDHNSNRYDYCLTSNETYSKNHTAYIKDALYFKNDITELEADLYDYEVVEGQENIVIEVMGVMYDWNPNRNNWRIWVSKDLTVNNLLNT